jgi:hypothetical protein
VVVLLGAAAPLVACGDCEDEVEAAQAFLDNPANLACQSDEDCAVVSTGCHTFSRGICAQAHLGQTAAASQQWSELKDALDDCDSGTCTQCLAELLARCTDGLCGGPK